MKMTKKDDRFLEACQKSDWETLEKSLDAGISFDGVEGVAAFARPLGSALLCKQWKVAHWLLDQGADPVLGASELDDPIEQLEKDRDGEIRRLIQRMLVGLEDQSGVDFEKLLGKAFYKACEHGHLAIAQQIFRMWKDPSKVKFRHSPVGWAAINGHCQTVAWLCQNGFDHLCQHEDRVPPAVYAILGRSAESLRALLDNGESPHRTALAHQLRMIRVEYLDDLPSNKQHEIFHEGGLLHFAVISGDVICVNVLLDAGADPAKRDSEGRTALMLAKLGGKSRQAVAERLALVTDDEPLEPNVMFRQGVLQDDVAAVREALAGGVDRDQPIQSEYGNDSRAMTIAARQGSISMLQTLVEGGVDLEQLDCDSSQRVTRDGASFLIEEMGLDGLKSMPMSLGQTPLLCAAADGRIEAMQWLIERGAALDASNWLGMNALHVASLNNQVEAIDWLLGNGFGIDDTAINQLTALHIAAVGNSRQAVLQLLELGADPTARNASRETPYDMAKDHGKPATYRALEGVTPKEARKRRRKPQAPTWTFDAGKRKEYLTAARQRCGKAAVKLSAAKFQTQLRKRGESPEFQTAVTDLGERLGAKVNPWSDELPSVHELTGGRLLNGKLTEGRLSKLQKTVQTEKVFVVRQLRSDDGSRLFAVAAGDAFEAIAAMRLNGANHGISTKELLAWLMSLAERYPFELVALDTDGLQIRFDAPVSDVSATTDELMMICPPEDFEERALKSLKKQLRNKRPKVTLWWH